MRYISTRGNSPSISFTQLVMSGTAPDGGLYVPEDQVKINIEALAARLPMSYADMAYHVVSPFIGRSMHHGQLRRIISQAYTADRFRHVGDGDAAENIVPVRKLWDNTFLVRLSNGPTLAFKDVAMQLLAPLVAEVLKNQRYSILGATSGDTGSAAIAAFAPYKNIDVFMMSGGSGMSPFQMAQMYAVNAKNVHNLRLQDFDAAQKLLKEVFSDRTFVEEVNLGAVNSVNLVRILAQVVYSFWAYFQVSEKIGEEIDFVVPSGNFGNAFSVYLAKLMGLPVGRIVIATNENDVLHRAIATGVYAKATQVIPTKSPSMDIQVSSNFERALYFACKGDAQRIAHLYAQFATQGEFTLEQTELNTLREAGFVSGTCTMVQARSAMRQVFDETGVQVDPHTAVAMFVASSHKHPGRKQVVFETAQPGKFADEVEAGTGKRPSVPRAFAGMACAPQRVDTFDELTPGQLKQYILDRQPS